MRHIQRFTFWAFVGVFFITASLVLLYAFGYRFNFQRGIFIYTGSISIKSNPQNVDISIDDELIPSQRISIINNAILVSGLAPGEHFIKVFAEGYLPWSKKAIVQSGLSTDFWNVLLVKENASPQKIDAGDSALKIFPAPDKNLFAIAKTKNDEFTVDTLNTDTMESNQVFSSDKASLSSDEENIEWSPDNRKLIVPLERDGERAYSVVNIKDKTSAPLQESSPIARSLHNPRWDPTTRDFLFYIANGALYRADTETPENTPLFIKENVCAYNISGNNIYYLSSDNGIVYRIPANGTDAQPTQITTTSIDLNLNNAYALVAYDDNRIAIREHENGKIWIYNKLSNDEIIFKTLAESGAKGMQFSDDGKKLLFFSDNEISVYFTNAWETQPTREKNTTLQVARFSNTIKNVEWTKDYEHILFTANGSAKIAELDHRDRRNIEQVVSFPTPITQALSRFESNRIYFILETGELYFIEFPAPQNNLFGF
jgi:hypothetical protein